MALKFVGVDVKPDLTVECKLEEESEYDRTCRIFRQYQDQAFEIFCDRHHKYGPGNIATNGHGGVIVRIQDKIARLKNNTEDFADESVADAHLDISNFGIIGLMVLTGEWPCVEEQDRIAVISAQIAALEEELLALTRKAAS